jgi:hypothetical protein
VASRPEDGVTVEGSRGWSINTDTGLVWDPGRSTHVEAAYNRQQHTALGFGRNLLIDQLFTTLTQKLGRRWDTVFRAETLGSSDVLLPDVRFRAQRYSAQLSFHPMPAIGFTGGYSASRFRGQLETSPLRHYWNWSVTYRYEARGGR